MALGEAVVAQQGVPYRERPEPYERNERTYQPGVFDYYLLALSWSPTYCAGISDGRYDPQCHGRDRRPLRVRAARTVAAVRAALAAVLPHA